MRALEFQRSDTVESYDTSFVQPTQFSQSNNNMNERASVTSEISDDSTVRPTVEDCVDHVNINNLVLDKNNDERPPFLFNCGCCKEEINCSRAFLVLSSNYILILMVILFSFTYLMLAPSSSYSTGIIAVLSTCIGYLIPKHQT